MSAKPSREAIRSALDAYFHGLRTGDASQIPFTDDVEFIAVVLDEPLAGETAVRQYVGGFSEGIASLDVHQVVIDGRSACAIFEWRTKSGTELHICDHMMFDGSKISYVRPYFDPRPILGA